MQSYADKKLYWLCKSFPSHADKMCDLQRAFDGVYQRPVETQRDMQDYVISFAIYSDLTIHCHPQLKLPEYVNTLLKQEKLLNDAKIERIYNINHGASFMEQSGYSLRLKHQNLRETVYLTSDKIPEFSWWLKNQIASDKRCLRKTYDRRADLRLEAAKNIVLMQIIPEVKNPDTPDVWEIADDDMHEVAMSLAQKSNISNPNEVLNDLVVQTVRRNIPTR